MPNAQQSRDVAEALEALERLLHRYKVIDEQQAQAAARLITGDESFVLPSPPSAPPAEGQRGDREAQPAH